MIRCKLLDLPGIDHGFGERGERLPPIFPLVETHQTHGTAVHRLDLPLPTGRLEGDSFVTAREAVVCFVRTADCVPLLWCDPVAGLVGAIHAGWRGTLAGVTKATIDFIQKEWGSTPRDLRVVLGPSIRHCCYRVGEEVAALFHGGAPKRVVGLFVDLAETNRDQLLQAGVPESQIAVLPHCTHCEPGRFYSYRRDPLEAGRQWNYMVKRGDPSRSLP